MPYLMIRNDITKVHTDAIVNPSNTRLRQGSGTSRAIFLAAGEKKLENACRKLKTCKKGESVITDGFDLPAKYIIHAVGPVWHGGWFKEEETLYRTYLSALNLALEHHCKSIAFPLLSSGNYGFPKSIAMKIAIAAISAFLDDYDMLVYLVFYDKVSYSVSQTLFASVKEYIDDHYVETHDESYPNRYENSTIFESSQILSKHENFDVERTLAIYTTPPPLEPGNPAPQQSSLFAPSASPTPLSAPKRSLDELMKNLDETFSQMLLRLIDERGLKDSAVYKKANIDRRHFSKIRKDIYYSPTKKTVFSFAIALELSLDESIDLLNKAGYCLSRSSRFDIIISYFLENKIYNIFDINEVLFAYEQPLLGE